MKDEKCVSYSVLLILIPHHWTTAADNLIRVNPRLDFLDRELGIRRCSAVAAFGFSRQTCLPFTLANTAGRLKQ